jgi:hypothetical protein
LPRPVSVDSDLFWVQQPAQVGFAVIAAVQQFVFDRAVTPTARDHVFQFNKVRQVDFQLQVAPARRRARRAA